MWRLSHQTDCLKFYVRRVRQKLGAVGVTFLLVGSIREGVEKVKSRD
jgi:hypothetical protein